jgi:hypothetical protein
MDIVDWLSDIGFKVKTATRFMKNSSMSHAVIFVCQKQ